ncbi:hypothetical protein [Streptosporangium sp. NPDC051022]|uniref:hypothetical protein n=1 Tax=Streptosporangium sp. NPDC051022 TaxID=3155752 RepID=UPI003444AE9D
MREQQRPSALERSVLARQLLVLSRRLNAAIGAVGRLTARTDPSPIPPAQQQTTLRALEEAAARVRQVLAELEVR